MAGYLFFFIIVIYYFHAVVLSKLIFIERDLSSFFIPPRYLWVTLLKSFEMPFWNQYNYTGIPLLATIQPGILYPPHIMYLLLPFNIAWNWLIILHFLFAGLSTYILLKYLKASKEGSFLGAVTFTFSGYLLSVHNLLPHLLAVAWFPLIMMLFIKYYDTRKTKFIVFTALAITLQFFTGALEIVIMTGFVLCIISIFIKSFIEHNIGCYLRLKVMFLVLFLSFLLSSIQLLPFYELKLQSIRYSGLSYFEATTWSFAWKDFVQFFLPNVYGYFQNDQKYWLNQSWLKTIYLGIMPFVLSIFYFLSKDRKKIIFFLLILLSFIFALGNNTPLYKLLYHIPPFNSVRYPVKFLFLFFVIISITTGLGFDALKKGIEEKNPRTKIMIRSIFYFGFLFVLAWGYIMLFKDNVYNLFDRMGIKPDVYNDINYNIHNIKRFLFFSFLFCTMLLVALPSVPI